MVFQKKIPTKNHFCWTTVFSYHNTQDSNSHTKCIPLKVLTYLYSSGPREMQAQFPDDEGILILRVRSERSGLKREVSIDTIAKESPRMKMRCLTWTYSSFR